jgi:hypothetical protein
MTAALQKEPFERRMLCDALADSIRERLFGGEFAPRVPLDEAALAAHYGTGRLPLKAALEQLVRDCLLTARAQGGYCVAEYCRADIEDILTLLEHIRCSVSRRQVSPPGGLPGAAGFVVAASPYWGDSGLVVELPFAVAARSLYEQLRLGVGPALAAIEAQCAQTRGPVPARAGESGQIEDFRAESARMFRQQVLAAFDAARARRA